MISGLKPLIQPNFSHQIYIKPNCSTGWTSRTGKTQPNCTCNFIVTNLTNNIQSIEDVGLAAEENGQDTVAAIIRFRGDIESLQQRFVKRQEFILSQY